MGRGIVCALPRSSAEPLCPPPSTYLHLTFAVISLDFLSPRHFNTHVIIIRNVGLAVTQIKAIIVQTHLHSIGLAFVNNRSALFHKAPDYSLQSQAQPVQDYCSRSGYSTPENLHQAGFQVENYITGTARAARVITTLPIHTP